MPVDLLFATQGKSLEPHGVGDVPEYRLYSAESLTIDMTTSFGVDLALHLLDETALLVCFSDTLFDGHLACRLLQRVAQATVFQGAGLTIRLIRKSWRQRIGSLH